MMNRMKAVNCLQLQNDLASDHEIETVHIQIVSSISDWKSLFTFERDVVGAQFITHGATVRLLNQPGSKLPVNCDAAAYSPVDEFFEGGPE